MLVLCHSNDELTDHVTSSIVQKALRSKVESRTACGAIYFGNLFCYKVIDHLTSSTLKKASRLKVESSYGRERKISAPRGLDTWASNTQQVAVPTTLSRPTTVEKQQNEELNAL